MPVHLEEDADTGPDGLAIAPLDVPEILRPGLYPAEDGEMQFALVGTFDDSNGVWSIVVDRLFGTYDVIRWDADGKAVDRVPVGGTGGEETEYTASWSFRVNPGTSLHVREVRIQDPDADGEFPVGARAEEVCGLLCKYTAVGGWDCSRPPQGVRYRSPSERIELSARDAVDEVPLSERDYPGGVAAFFRPHQPREFARTHELDLAPGVRGWLLREKASAPYWYLFSLGPTGTPVARVRVSPGRLWVGPGYFHAKSRLESTREHLEPGEVPTTWTCDLACTVDSGGEFLCKRPRNRSCAVGSRQDGPGTQSDRHSPSNFCSQ